jgi:urea carboxylase
LLRFFDQIRFYPVEAAELLEMRHDFVHGKYHPEITEEQFVLRDYHEFLKGIGPEAEVARTRQQAAFEAERERWRQAGLDRRMEPERQEAPAEVRSAPEGCRAVKSPAHASVWSVLVKPGDKVARGERMMIVESMKMEIAVAAPQAGTVVEILCPQGTHVVAGQSLLFLRPEAV